MTRLLDLNRLAPLAFACSLTALGCDAPDKSVGQETQGGTGGESDSGSGAETTAGGSESGSESGSGGSDACTSNTDEDSCGEADACVWVPLEFVSEADATCEFVDEPHGICAPFSPGGACESIGCGGTVGGPGHAYRQVEPGLWEVATGDCGTFFPLFELSGFAACDHDGVDPAVCNCMCDSGSEASLPEGFESTLSELGCADMVVFGASADGSIGLALSTGGEFTPVADALAAGETLITTHDVSDFARLVVMVGTNVTYPECNDALDPEAYAIDEEWVAVAGSVEIMVVPEVDPPKFSTQGLATVTITDLEVTFDGVTEAVGTVTFEDVAVGWLPG